MNISNISLALICAFFGIYFIGASVVTITLGNYFWTIVDFIAAAVLFRAALNYKRLHDDESKK